jgi:hypothetical protein
LAWKIGASIILAMSDGYGDDRDQMRRCGEADLVVDDEVQRAAGTVALEAGETEAFGHHTLACEGGIAMDQQRHHGRAGLVATLVLLGTGLAEDNRIDDLEVRRVGGERKMHRVAVKNAV